MRAYLIMAQVIVVVVVVAVHSFIFAAMAYEMVRTRIVASHAVMSKIARDHPAFQKNSEMQSIALHTLIRTGLVLGLPSSFKF